MSEDWLNDPTERALRDAFVYPFYLSLLHGNFIGGRYGAEHSRRIADAARTISDEQIGRLLSQREWRGRLVAGWFTGLTKRSHFVRDIVDLLIASEMVYAGEGYCIALALIGDAACAEGLRAYLAKYLPLNGRVYNQDWAIGALTVIGGHPPGEFLDAALWTDGSYHMDSSAGIRDVAEIVAYVQRNAMTADS